MTTLAANSNVTLTLTDYDSVTISCRGPVIVEAVSGLGLTAGKIAEFDGTRTFGPFTAAGSLKLATQGAPAEYEVADGTARGGAVEYAMVGGQVAGLAGPGGVISLAGDPSVLRPGFPLMRRPSALSPMTIAGGGTGQIVTRNGVNCVEITANPGAQQVSLVIPISSGLQDGNVQLVMEFEDMSAWNGGVQRLRFCSDINLNVGMNCERTVGAGNGWTGVQVLAPMAADWTAVGAGSFAATNMTYAQVKVQTSGAASPGGRVWVYSLVKNERRSLPRIYFGADDGDLSWYTLGLPILEKYGFKSYLAYMQDFMVSGHAGSHMNLADWQDAVARGHEPVIHGCKDGIASLRTYLTTYTGYAAPYDAIYADITYNRDGMIANGLDPSQRGRKIYVLPQGNHQPIGGAGDMTIVNALRAAGVTVCRLAAANLGCSALVVNPQYARQAMYLPNIGHSYAGGSEAANIAALVALMQAEVAKGRDVIFMFHKVTASPAISEDVSPTNLETIVAAAATLVNGGTALAGSFHELPQLMAVEAAKLIS